MQGTVLTIIGATTTIIIVYLILTMKNASGNAFADLLGNVGNSYRQIVDTFMGQPYG